MKNERRLKAGRYVLLAFCCMGLAVNAGPGAKPQAGPEQRANSSAPAKPPATGLVADRPIDTRMFQTPHDYFTNSVQRKVYKAYKAREGMAMAPVNKLKPDDCIAYAESQTTVIYVPAAYDGTEAYGVYVHNSPGEQGMAPSEPWQRLMDKLKLIYISPNQAGNNMPDLRRIVLALDSLATVMRQYKIDDQRVYVGGLSGGGYVGMLCQMYYPEIFHGAVSHAAQSYLPESAVAFSHFAGLSLIDAKKPPRKERKWVVISGNLDQNYEAIKKTSKEWLHAHFLYRFIDVPGMAHENAPAPALEEALLWIGTGLPDATSPAQ